MAKPTAPQCHALTTYFKTKYNEAQGREPVVSRNKARWWFEAILMDYSASQARELIDYYIEHYQVPELEWFAYNYDKVDAAKTEHDKNELSAVKRRQETAVRLEEWRKRWQK